MGEGYCPHAAALSYRQARLLDGSFGSSCRAVFMHIIIIYIEARPTMLCIPLVYSGFQLRSNIPWKRMVCACGSSFTVEHVLSCPRGGFPIIRHNEIRDVTATMLTEVCHDVLVEPDLQPLSGEVLARASSIRTDGARLDIAVNGLWGGRFERSFLDVRVFNPHAPSNRNSTISTQCN